MSEPTKTSAGAQVLTSARAHVLIVEDSSVFREMQGLLLRQAGYAVSGHEHPEAALAAAKERAYDLVIIDYELPGMNGEQFMHALRKILPDIAVVFVSGSLTLELAIHLSSQGVAGIFNKPANPKTLLEKINETLARNGSRDAVLPGRSNSPLPAARRGNSNSPFATVTAASVEPADDQLAYVPQHVFGRSEPFREFTHRLWKVRDFRAVLLLQGGEGSPFVPLARELAEISIFRNGPVMVCDAARFETRHLIEVLAPSLLSQDAGTLVVTGVETFTPEQQKVLQILTSGRDVFLPFARRFRLVLAAAANLSELADAGLFNETLFYKISSLSLAVPPLGEMAGDILLNARHLLEEHCTASNLAAPLALEPAAEAWLVAQAWPGNYDQLFRVLIGAIRDATGLKLTVTALEASLRRDDETTARNRPAASVRRRTDSPFATKTAAAPTAVAVTPTIESIPARAVATPPPAPARPVPVEPIPARTAMRTARNIFRPASRAYDFGQRLAASLGAAEAAAVS